MPAVIHSLTTSAVDSARSFEYWRSMISDTFVPLTAEPVGSWSRGGHIRHGRYTGLDVSTVRACGQHVRRTRGLISRSDDAYLLASIQVSGRGLVQQSGREPTCSRATSRSTTPPARTRCTSMPSSNRSWFS